MDDKNKIIRALWDIHQEVFDEPVGDYRIASFLDYGFTPEELRDALELDEDGFVFSRMKEIYDNKE